MSEIKSKSQGSLTAYIVGFLLSVGLTLAAYYLVVNQVLSGNGLVIAIMTLAVVQLFVQLIFFLHLGKESYPMWNLQMFLYAVMIVLTIVIGSIWIMNNLDYNMMTSPEEINKSVSEEERIHR